MTKQQAASYVYAQAVSANLHGMAMSMENADAEDRNIPHPYRPSDFRDLIDYYGLSHNYLLTLFNNCED